MDGLRSASLIFGNNNESLVSGQKGIAALILALGGLSWGFGYLGQPHLLIRYMAIRSSEEVALARKIAICWAIRGVIGAFFIGVIAMMYFGPAYFQTIDPDQSMPILASELLHPVIAGLFISGAVAAMMSTADSQLLVSASAITEDFFHQFLNKDISDKNLVKLSRFMIIILGIIAYCIALYSEIKGKNIFGVVSYAWSGLGSAFGPVLVMTLWWEKTSRIGVISGLVTGFLTTILWANIPELKAIVTERLSSFVFAFCVVYIISYYYPDETKRSN